MIIGLGSYKLWQVYHHPNPKYEEKVFPVYDVIRKQAERDKNEELRKVAEILRNIDKNYQEILLIGDINNEFLEKLNGEPVADSSNPIQLYIAENNMVLTIFKGIEYKMIADIVNHKTFLRIVFVCDTVSIYNLI